MLLNFCTFHLTRYREKVRESGGYDKQNKRKQFKKSTKNDEVLFTLIKQYYYLNKFFLEKYHNHQL